MLPLLIVYEAIFLYSDCKYSNYWEIASKSCPI